MNGCRVRLLGRVAGDSCAPAPLVDLCRFTHAHFARLAERAGLDVVQRIDAEEATTGTRHSIAILQEHRDA